MGIFTFVDTAEVQSFLKNYSLGSLVTIQGISEGVTNTNYLLETTQNRYILTIFEQHTSHELAFYIDLQAFLMEKHFSSAHPVRGKKGGYLHPLKDKPAGIFSFLKGQSHLSPSAKQCKELGKQLALFHTHSLEFEGSQKNTRGLNWMKTGASSLHSHLSQADQTMLSQEIHAAENIHGMLFPTGIIHADLFRDNVLFDQENLTGIIDFYYACNGAFIYDLAIVVNDWAYTQREQTLLLDHLKALLQGYQSIRPLLPLEILNFVSFLRMAALRFLISRWMDFFFRKPDAQVAIKDPNYFYQLLCYYRTPSFVQELEEVLH